jgi:hypothetical protein
MLSCTAGCSLPAADVVEAGLQLGLCIRHLDALRRTCKGKQRLAYAKLAAREAARITAAGRAHRPGHTLAAYRCPLCRAWHAGHQRDDGDGVHAEAVAAAHAVRSHLTGEQLNHLCTQWRAGITRRPRRKRKP